MAISLSSGTAEATLGRARQLHQRGVVEGRHGRPVRGLRLLEQALGLLERDPDGEVLRGRVLISRALLESEVRGVPSAQPTLDAAEELCTRLGDREGAALVRAQRGTMLYRLGRFADAATELRAATAGTGLGPLDRANALLTLGTCDMLGGHLTTARGSFERSLAVAREHQFGLEAFKAEFNLGYLSFLQGDLPGALASMDRAAAAEPAPRQGITLLDRARVLAEAGLLQEADEALDQAATLFARQRLQQDLGEVELSRAEIALLRGEPGTARRFAVRARLRFRRRSSARWLHQADLLVLQADFLAGRRTGAMLTSADALAQRLTAAGHHSAARMAGLVAAELRLARAGGDPVVASEQAVPAAIERDDPIAVRLHARYVQARLAQRCGDRPAAERAVRAGLADLTSYRARFGSIDMQTASAIHGQRLAELGIRLALSRGERGAGPCVAVLAAAERGRAVSSRLPAVRPPQDETTARLLGDLRQVVEQARAVDLDRASADELNRRRTDLERLIAGRAWTRGGAGAVQRPAALGEVRAALVARDAVMAYLIVTDGVLHALVTGRAPTRLVALGDVAGLVDQGRRVRADLDVLAADGLPAMIRRSAAGSLRRGLHQLDARLLAPLTLPDSRLVVVPTGALTVLPWSLLPSLRGVPVEVATSATAWLSRASAPTADSGDAPRVAAISGPGLHRAEDEVGAVAGQWRGSTLLCRGEADSASVVRAITGHDVVHIAAHGRHASQSPLFSYLRLADGPLFAHELEHAGRLAEHIVLSACELGTATVRPGDEALGLSSVLLHLGARSVVAGVAAVNDFAACEAMVDYHARLRRGADSAQALAEVLAASPADVPLPLVCLGAAWRPA